MSKRFVEFVEFKDELKGIRDEITDLKDNIDVIVDTVNANADNGESVEKRINELSQTVKKLESKTLELSSFSNRSTDNGVIIALLALFGFCGFCVLLNEIGKLEKQLNALKGKGQTQPAKDKPIEVNFRDDNITYTVEPTKKGE